jgi:TDG/mug DNA glycosylase family protein
MRPDNGDSFLTLPDYLASSLELVFVGINPGLYSARRGHYFARTTSRFWPAFSRSWLSERIRDELRRPTLRPEDDGALLRFGIGFSDVVKVASRNAAELRVGDFQEWSPRLLAKLETYRPRIACFHGVTAYAAFSRYALRRAETRFSLGPQSPRVGHTGLFVVPNPSPANAHFRLEDQVAWYDRLAEFMWRGKE